MAVSMKDLGIDQFSKADRLTLVYEIWESLAEHVEEAPLTEAERSELERRLAAHKASPGGTRWEEVKAWTLSRARQ